jgi:hypothetical protein
VSLFPSVGPRATDERIIRKGDALDLLPTLAERPSVVATDPPYAWSGAGAEHELTSTVAVVLREAARLLLPGGWMLIMCASSWRSQSYMASAVRGLVEPVRTGTWVKPRSRTKVQTPGWDWASVSVLAFRKGKSADLAPCDRLDWIEAEPVMNGRRAELPSGVADWMVSPFAVPGGLVLDPFAGSGALLLAGQRAGMRAVGFDLEPLPHMTAGAA